MSSKSGLISEVISIPNGSGTRQETGEGVPSDLHTGTGNSTIPEGSPDILVQSRRDRQTAIRFLHKLHKGLCNAPRISVTNKLRSSAADIFEICPASSAGSSRGSTTGRKSAPAHLIAGAANAKIQVTALGSTIPVGGRPDQQPVLGAHSSLDCRCLSGPYRQAFRIGWEVMCTHKVA